MKTGLHNLIIMMIIKKWVAPHADAVNLNNYCIPLFLLHAKNCNAILTSTESTPRHNCGNDTCQGLFGSLSSKKSWEGMKLCN